MNFRQKFDEKTFRAFLGKHERVELFQRKKPAKIFNE